MVTVPSQMLALGTKAPEFKLVNVTTTDNKEESLNELKGVKGTLIMFICNHCPYVIHVRELFKPLNDEFKQQGVSFIAINSNSIETHPQDGPKYMKELVKEMDWEFSYLFDETQEVAKNYSAACTPDFFLFNRDLELYYRGQLDNSRPNNKVQLSGNDLKKALNNLVDGKLAPEKQLPSMGCNIKWKPENEPKYFLNFSQ